MADVKYRHAHQQKRKAWAPRVKAGGVCCVFPRCGRPIVIDPSKRDQGWQLDHTYGGPAHSYCNESHGGRIGARITHARRRRARLPVW